MSKMLVFNLQQKTKRYMSKIGDFLYMLIEKITIPRIILEYIIIILSIALFVCLAYVLYEQHEVLKKEIKTENLYSTKLIKYYYKEQYCKCILLTIDGKQYNLYDCK